MKKKCVQCGRVMEEESFTRYPPRGNGIYNTVQGRHTVCIACEQFNAKVNRAYFVKEKDRTNVQQKLVDDALKVYKMFVDKGFEPKGRCAKDMLKSMGFNIASARKPNDHIVDDYLSLINPVTSYDTMPLDIKHLLEFKFDPEFKVAPEDYEEAFDAEYFAVREAHTVDGELPKEVKPLFDRIATLQSDYEDEYYAHN